MRVRDQALELAYVNKLRAELDTLDTGVLDDYRRLAETYGDRIIIGDLSGDELARLCDEEIAARHVIEAANA